VNENPSKRPVLFVDVDGVISLFGFSHAGLPPGRLHWVDGVAHCISDSCGERLRLLEQRYEMVWATGWEEKANEYLPFLLELGGEYPVLTFDGLAEFGTAHWKLGAIDRYAADRPAAWIDDSLDRECERWARNRPAPTLLIRTDPAVGLSEEHVAQLFAWADSVS
jgi:Swiss Army Knife RNA repair-like protein